MIDKIGTMFRPFIKKKKEEDDKQRVRKDKNSREHHRQQKEDDPDEFSHLLSTAKDELSPYLEKVNNLEYYKDRSLEFKIAPAEEGEALRVIVENVEEKKVIHKISVEQFMKIHNQISNHDEHPRSGQIINIKC